MLRKDSISARKPDTRRMKPFRQPDTDPSLTYQRCHLNPIPVLQTQVLPSFFVHPKPGHIIATADGHEIGLIRRHGMSMNRLLPMEQSERMRVFGIGGNQG